MILPTSKSAIERVSPKNMLLYGLPKCGKTTILSTLDNCLVIDTEDGTDFVEIMKIKIDRSLDEVGRMKQLLEVAREIKKQGKPYKYVAIDTLSEVDNWAEWVGTARYMGSNQGQTFNRFNPKDHPDPKFAPFYKKEIPKNHQYYESVHNLGNGYGYRWSREEMQRVLNECKDLGSICTIFIAHVQDKIVTTSNNKEVNGIDISLTGKVRNIFAKEVDAIGYVYSEKGQTMISFKGNEERVGGIRGTSIVGYQGPLDFSKIFSEDDSLKSNSNNKLEVKESK